MDFFGVWEVFLDYHRLAWDLFSRTSYWHISQRFISHANNLKMRDIVIKHPGTRFWFIRSEEEMKRIEERDREAGRFLDSAGETLIYSPLGSGVFEENTVVSVIKKRGIKWPHWTKKPKYLVEGLATIDNCPRIVMIQVQ